MSVPGPVRLSSHATIPGTAIARIRPPEKTAGQEETMINPVAQGYGVQATLSPTGRTQAAPDQSSASATGDTVTFSEEALLLSKARSTESSDSMGLAGSTGRSSSLLDTPLAIFTPEELADKSDEVRDRITALFLEKGIPTDPPVDLTVDEAGAIRVNGNHPHKEEIEAALAKDESLSNDFRLVSSQTSIQKAIADHIAFSEAYEEDPEAALIRFSYLFDHRPDEPFIMTVGGEADA